MRHFIATTFGGLSLRYFLRQLFFGIGMSVLIVFAITQGDGQIRMDQLLLLTVNALLYPYSRFIYEQAVGFLLGDNVFFVNAVMLLVVKIFTMTLCWSFAIFIAPLGLAYLFFYHRRAQSHENIEG
ncbi:hypothetical protein HOP51_08780 [Halomonas sp. MCCC 1A11036]|uniref:Uncharacterized protein n=1 Tax=Billgrantia zhangzhouensis TaxID=2733481 RepID=A0ABS9AEN5_9GAMM|nr:hypothetical protein [Halomonas zhangzhouensis]MCE8020202.1 hypothetical protein [Halomonas zhangzhouensis]